MDIREAIAQYLRENTREGDCPCAQHQKQMYDMANEILALFRNEIENLPMITEAQKRLAVQEWLDQTAGEPDAMPDYSDIIAQAQLNLIREYLIKKIEEGWESREAIGVGYVKLAQDQSLPNKDTLTRNCFPKELHAFDTGHFSAQQDMLRAGFRRVVLDMKHTDCQERREHEPLIEGKIEELANLLAKWFGHPLGYNEDYFYDRARQIYKLFPKTTLLNESRLLNIIKSNITIHSADSKVWVEINYTEIAEEICKLFSKTIDNPDGFAGKEVKE